MNSKEAIQEAIEDSPKRSFTQTVEIAINFKDIDLSDQENKIKLDVILPNGLGKEKKICAIGTDELKAKVDVPKFISEDELEDMEQDEAKKLAKEYDAFISEPSLMALVGKKMGQALGPRGKMPQPVPPAADAEPILNKLKRRVQVRTKGDDMPVVHAPVGTEEMTADDLTENTEAVVSSVKEDLPHKEKNIKSVYVKTTMGPTKEITEY